jgi:uncharacterized membrane protein
MGRENKDRITAFRSRNLALAAVFGAIYAALVIVFAPFGNLPIQVRVADALMPLAILFGWPAIFGLGIGTVVANLAGDSITAFPSTWIPLDIVGGSLVNLLAGFLAWKIGQRSWRIGGGNASWFAATLAETAVISVVVGGYLSFIFSIPLALSILGIFAGELVAINIGGFVLLSIIGRPRSLDLLRSWGLQIYGPNRDQ